MHKLSEGERNNFSAGREKFNIWDSPGNIGITSLILEDACVIFLPQSSCNLEVGEVFAEQFAANKRDDDRITKFTNYLVYIYIEDGSTFPPHVWASSTASLMRTTNRKMAIQSLTENYGNKTFMNLDMSELGIDEAYLILTNLRGENTFFYNKYKECINCPFIDEYGQLPDNMTTVIQTGYERMYKVVNTKEDILPSNSSSNVLCNIDGMFGEFGVYQLIIKSTGCTLETLKKPVNIYLPILTVFVIFAAIFICLGLCRYILKRIRNKPVVNKEDASDPPKKERIKSLDTFRGITIALMIFVNYGGGDYKFIEHAVWNGLHIADLVFPWFLWIMGVCIPMSIRSIVKSGIPTRKALLRIARRSIILFMIGLFLGAGRNLKTFRILGVLQRFGISYFAVASICFLTMKYLEKLEFLKTNKIEKMFADIIKIKISWLITLTILVVYSIIVFAIPFEDCPSGYLGPGGHHENDDFFNCTGGITGYIDRLVLGLHMYQYAAIRQIYGTTLAFDPEGILGCLPSIVHVFIGVQAGSTLMTFRDHKARLIRWIVWAVALGILGGGLCGFTRDNGVIPLNKNLWSLSFVFVTSTLAFLLLSVCYILVDVKKIWGGKPFLYAGMNAIILYIGHSMTYSNFLIRWHWNNNNTHFLALLENTWATSLWLLISYFLYKKKWFLTI